MSIKYVEYLEGDGASYIDTIGLPGGTYNIEMKYNDDTVSTTAQNRLISLTNNSFYYQINQYGIRQVKDSNRNNEQYIDKIVNNVLTDTFTIADNASNLRIFHSLTVAKIYYIKLYDTSNNLLYHFRGALDNNNIPCLHETVNDIVYYNNGSGTFAHGDFVDALYLFANNNEGTAEDLGSYRLYNMEIEGDSEGVESGIDYVDCLIGDNDSYIDTGIVVATGYQIDVTFMLTDKNSYSSIGGAIYGVSNDLTVASDNTYGTSVAYVWNGTITIRDNGSGGANNHYGSLGINESTCLNNKYTLSRKLVNVTNNKSLYLMANHVENNANHKSTSSLRIYNFKIYNAEGTLIQHLRPCVDTEGIPCMYDEVSKKYFYNKGSGTFGYKKKLRDFQPVLDSNGIPTLMDKVNKKYYYDKNGKGFRYEESYKPVSYLEGDGNSWIDTGILGNLQYKYEMIVEDNTTDNYENFFGSHIGANDLCICRRIEGKEINFGYNGTIFAGFALPTSKSTIYIDKNKLYINNSLVKTATETTQTTCHNTISIYTIRNGSTINSMSNIKVYSFKMWNENSELILDLIPVLDKNNTPCMYDKVSKQFFYNQGDGEFSYGIEEDECPPVNYIEYLETDGNCIIPTRRIKGVTTDLVVEAKMKLSVDNSTYYVFGTMGAYTMSRTGIVKTNDRKLQFIYLQRNSTKVDFTNTDVHTFKIDKNGGYIDGELKCDLSSGESNFNTNNFADSPFYLFGNYYTTAYKYDYAISGTRIYYVTLSQNGEVLADFRPCLDDNGTPCIYDAVTGEYYYNSGTGTFNGYGKSIGYTPIKYIETNGTQYIDTGVVPTDNTDIDMVARACEPIITGDTGQVEYLQGDRNSWIDTGIKANVKYKYEVVMQDDSTNNYGAIFGTDNNCTVFKNGETGLKFTYSQNHLYGSNYSLNEKTTITVDEHNLLVNGSTAITHSSAYLTSNFSKNTIIFASSNGTFTPCSSKIYSFKMWDNNGNLVFDGVPYVNNGVPCMYNVVTDEYLYNQGSGTFSYGELVASSSFKNYLMNDFYTDTTYKYKEIDTTVEPNLTASEGATLTLGSTYMSYLSEEELEQATKNGWIIE